MAKKLEEVLLPHEVDKDGKKLETPGEVDVEAIRAWALGLVNAEEELRETVADKDTELATAKDALTELQRQNENDEQRRAREQKERDAEFEQLRKRDQERSKVEAISAKFADKGITAEQAKRLAKRVGGDDEKAWLSDAEELVSDGFKVGTAPAKTGEGETEETPSTLPRVVRTDGTPPIITTNKPKSIAEELDAAGVGKGGW